MIRKILLIALLILNSCGVFQSVESPKREFRAVWIATVVNIDWPKSGMDDWEKKQADFLRILSFYQDLNFNAVIVQVRTAGDAFYASDYAPWSRFLTGTEGIPPADNSEPLHWMIEQAHIRGFEFHAWLNPYRATFDLNTELLAPTHDYLQHPEWMIPYGTKYYYDPGLPEVRQHLNSVVRELVKSYDIDGVHYDDYFYPYTIRGETFNDSLSYATHARQNQSLEDWRRSNIDSLVYTTSKVIKQEKDWVRFGISPFGVWQNNNTDPRGSDTQAGQTTYSDLYADPLLWMEKEWLDYLVPQIYWSMDLSVASHKKLMSWWAGEVKNTNLYIGNGAYKIRNNSDKAWDHKKELPNQIELARATSQVSGNALYSAKSLMKANKDVVKYLKKRIYKYPSLIPHYSTSNPIRLAAPKLYSINEKANTYQITIESGHQQWQYAMVYSARKKGAYGTDNIKNLIIKKHLAEKNSLELPKHQLKRNKKYAITFIDSYLRESEPVLIKLNQRE